MKEGRDLETSMELRKVPRLFVSGFLLRLPLHAHGSPRQRVLPGLRRHSDRAREPPRAHQSARRDSFFSPRELAPRHVKERKERSFSDRVILTHRDELQKSHSTRQPFKKSPSVAHTHYPAARAVLPLTRRVCEEPPGIPRPLLAVRPQCGGRRSAAAQEERSQRDFFEALRTSTGCTSRSSASKSRGALHGQVLWHGGNALQLDGAAPPEHNPDCRRRPGWPLGPRRDGDGFDPGDGGSSPSPQEEGVSRLHAPAMPVKSDKFQPTKRSIDFVSRKLLSLLRHASPGGVWPGIWG